MHTFLTELRDRDLLESSLVIITADHGDAFGEHGYYAHPRYLHESLLHVPLVMSLPEESVEKTITTPVSTIDIVPTVLACANLSGNLPGTSLLENSNLSTQGEHYVVFASATGENEHSSIRRFAARGQHWKAMLEREIESGKILTEQVYNLQVDPKEQDALEPTNMDTESIIRQLRDFSASRLSEQTEIGPDDNLEQSAEIEERLEALGYK
jgi:arylsulfatase